MVTETGIIHADGVHHGNHLTALGQTGHHGRRDQITAQCGHGHVALGPFGLQQGLELCHPPDTAFGLEFIDIIDVQKTDFG